MPDVDLYLREDLYEKILKDVKGDRKAVKTRIKEILSDYYAAKRL